MRLMVWQARFESALATAPSIIEPLPYRIPSGCFSRWNFLSYNRAKHKLILVFFQGSLIRSGDSLFHTACFGMLCLLPDKPSHWHKKLPICQPGHLLDVKVSMRCVLQSAHIGVRSSMLISFSYLAACQTSDTVSLISGYSQRCLQTIGFAQSCHRH